MLTCARCDKDHLLSPALCSGRRGPCALCNAPISVRDTYGIERLNNKGGSVICMNGHFWGNSKPGEDLRAWYEEQVKAYRARMCLQ